MNLFFPNFFFCCACAQIFILYAVYRVVKAIINLTKWTWKVCLRAPSVWTWRNVVCPTCGCGRTCVYAVKESCLGTCDCCTIYHNPWKKMGVV